MKPRAARPPFFCHPYAMRLRSLAALLLTALIAWGAPLLGAAAAGKPITQYLAFPPRTAPAAHAPLSGPWFALLAVPIVAAVALIVIGVWRAKPQGNTAEPQRAFPLWGWLGLALMAAGWFAAWSEITAAEWRRHAFTPLWFGYVLAMNALVYRSSGQSLLTQRPLWFAALFPVSAVFWWLFEYLNQFVRNWHYIGIEAGSDLDYFLQGTLPFSTVLPAVASTWMWLRQFPRLEALRLPAVSLNRTFAWVALTAGTLGLAAVGSWPETFFPMLWLGPLLVLCSLQELLTGDNFLSPVARGDWRPLVQPALAALACGILWEFWNYWSLAKWQYNIPYVQRLHVFEMPLLGYAGYLPFGVTCAAVIDSVARLIERRATKTEGQSSSSS